MAAYSLQDFLNTANSNTIRANNQYEVFCTSGYDEIDKVLQKLAPIYGQGFVLPARGIDYASVSFKGYEMTNIVPTRMTMEQDHTVTFLCDVNGELRRAMLAWQGKVMNPDISGGSYVEGDRGINEKSIIRVHLFDKDNETVIEKYKFFNVRITNVGNMTLTYDGGDKLTMEVGFKSTYWEIEESLKGDLIGQK